MRSAEGLRVAWALAVAMGVAAFVQETTGQASALPSSASPGTSAMQNAAAHSGPITIEFDVPEEVRTQAANGPDAVTGFRVGFFRANDSTAFRTVDFGRDMVTLRGQTARVTVSRENLPPGIDDAVIRVQTLSRGKASSWSNPVPLAEQPVAQAQPAPPRSRQPRAARTERPSNVPSRQRPRTLVLGDIEQYTLLSDSLRKLLPADAKVETELGRFRRIQDLALAVAISRDFNIPFTTLSRTLEGPPRLAPRNAVTKLRGNLDARSVIRKSTAEARKLMAASQGAGATVQ